MQVQKETDPIKIVTDPVMLAALASQGIDKDYVELWHDYAPRSLGKGYSPYCKFYRDLNSDLQFMVASGLPMVDAYGQGHELTWRDKNGSLENGNNIFHTVVNSNDTRIVVLSDQPNGAKKDDQVSFHPQLFIGGAEVQPVSPMPRLLETDPVNPAYNNNVLEWDYGVCRRRLRIIEGRFLGSWVFTAYPHDDVLIRYNQRGGLRLHLSFPGRTRGEDEEYIPRDYFDEKELPVIISDSATFYPDADPETSTVDGFVQRGSVNETWATIRAGAGTSASPSVTSVLAPYIVATTTTSRFSTLNRGIFLFDTSGLPDEATISGAILSLYGFDKADYLSASPDINIYSSNPATNTALVAADFTTLGSTAFSTTKTYAGWTTGSYNDFTLNANGLAAISKTGVTKFGARDATHDVGGSAPPWINSGYSHLRWYAAEQGAGYKPKLVVTYTAGEQKTSADSGAGAESIDIRTQEVADQGSGAEAGLAATMVLAIDVGNGSEMGGLVQSLSCYSSDAGGGADSLKLLSEEAGGDLRLHNRKSQVGLPHKEVRK